MSSIPGIARSRRARVLLGVAMCLTLPAWTPAARETAIFSAGCYWTVEAVFEHVRGVVDVEAGVSGREVQGSAYRRNPTGTTGLAEAVRVTWDPSKVSYEDLLRVFFMAAHDPTTTDRQGPDVGARYRSVLWVSNDTQRQAALAAIERLESGKAFPTPVVTQVASAGAFTLVAEDQQDFVAKNPDHPYVVAWDRPRIAAFRKSLPTLFKDAR